MVRRRTSVDDPLPGGVSTECCQTIWAASGKAPLTVVADVKAQLFAAIV
jgi:hypothetical protein